MKPRNKKVSHCGVCHTDLHFVNGDWGEQAWPIVPGHEIIGEFFCDISCVLWLFLSLLKKKKKKKNIKTTGKVTKVGKNVKNFKEGQRVGVGAQCFSCLDCPQCNSSQENYCPRKFVSFPLPLSLSTFLSL